MSESRENTQRRWKGIIEAGPSEGVRVCVFADREIWNIQEIIDQMNRDPKAPQLAGIIVPGGEFDKEIERLARRVNTLRNGGMPIPVEEEGGTRGWKFLGPGTEIDYMHVPYDAAQLRADDSYREAYGDKLADAVQSMGAKIVFLSNSKIILPEKFLKRMRATGVRVINVHPSVLPLLKGFRPEAKVNKGVLTKASGLTIHEVEADLDAGATLLQLYVSPAPYDPEEESRLGTIEYAKRREERTRLKIIDAESKYSAQVLALVASKRKRKTVEGAEAFAAEGRPGFENDPDYLKLLEEEGGAKPYKRVLFKVGREWVTAEQILRVPRYAEEKRPDVATIYSFKVVASNPQVFMGHYLEIVRIAEGIRELRTDFKTSMNQATGEITITMPYVADDLVQYAQFAGIECNVESTPTRVTTPRKPIRKD
ncbi:hypothetical protein K2X83_01445 [Patescibacteria group bacterium]|nr:hypothetical protein [Patescibacteria group bacterium]